MPYENVKGFQRVQAAIETTRGTEVATMTREIVPLQDGGVSWTYGRDREDAAEALRSFAGKRDTALTNETNSLSLEVRASYEEIPWWLSLSLNGDAASLTGVTDAQVPPGYTYAIDPLDTSDNLDTATVKIPDAAKVYTLRRWAVNSQTFRCNPNAGGEASWRIVSEGPAIFVGPDAFDSPTETSRTIVLSNGSRVYLDTASAIGTTQLTGLVRNMSFAITNNIEEKRFVEGGIAAASDFGRGEQVITGDFTIEFLDDTYFALMRANTDIKLRFEQTGAAINGTNDYTFQVDFPKAKLDAPSMSYAGNNHILTFPFVAEKPIGAAAIQTTTINAVATVTA